MRRNLLIAATILGLGAAGAGIAVAQPAPPPGPAGMQDGHPDAPPPPPGPMGWMGWMGWMHHPMGGPGMMGGGMMGGPMGGPMAEHMQMMRNFALIYRPADRMLTPPDVQKIAEGFLLWNGNHDWKVMDVKAENDHSIAFSLATKSGDVIARFTMDPHTGHLTRVG